MARKWLFIAALTMILIASAVPISTPERQYYTDVAENHWSYPFIELMGLFHIIPAKAGGAFIPELNTSVVALTEALDKLPIGDLNGDDLVDFNDLSAAAAVYASQNQAADLNGDGVVDLYDLNIISRQIGYGYTIIRDEFEPRILTPDALIMDFSINSSGEYIIWYYTYDSAGEISTLKSASLEPNCLLENNTVLNTVGHFCDLSWNETQKVDSIVVKDYRMLTSEKLLVADGKVMINDVEYAFAPTNIAVDGFEASPNALLLAPECIQNGTYDTADTYKVVLNKDDEVCAVIARTLPLPGIVQNVEGNVIQYGNTPPVKDLTVKLSHSGEWDGFADQGDFTGCSVLVERDGRLASLNMIQPLDAINVLKNYRGADYYLIVSSKRQRGTFSSFNQSGDNITKLVVFGMDWFPSYISDSDTGFYYSLDGGLIYGNNPNPTILEQYVGNEATLLLGATGKVACIITNTSKTNGVITNISAMQQSYGNPLPVPNGIYYRKAKLIRDDGTTCEFYITDDSFIAKTGPMGPFIKKIKYLSTSDSYTNTSYSLQNIEGLIQVFTSPDELVSGLVRITHNEAGIVNCIYVVPQTEIPLSMDIMDADNDLLKLNGCWYDTADAVVFNLSNGNGGLAGSTGDLINTTVEEWATLENNTGITIRGYQSDAQGISSLIVNGMVKQTPVISHYGIYTQQYSDSEDWIVLEGEEAYKAGSATPPALTKGDVICYTLEGDTINILEVVIPYGSTSDTIVKKIEHWIITLDDQTSYTVDENTRFFDVTNSIDLLSFGNISIGDFVRVIPDETNPGRAAVIAVFERGV